jgi:hypothetical protein
MLQPAYPYLDQINLLKSKLIYDERYKYYNFGGIYINHDISLDKTLWDEIHLVSINSAEKIIGDFIAIINRQTYNISSISILNFNSENNLIFANDAGKFFFDLFNKFNFNKVNWKVIIGNESEIIYDNLIKKYGGRIVGIYKKDIKLWDGQFYDMKAYEILKEEFNAKRRRI